MTPEERAALLRAVHAEEAAAGRLRPVLKRRRPTASSSVSPAFRPGPSRRRKARALEMLRSAHGTIAPTLRVPTPSQCSPRSRQARAKRTSTGSSGPPGEDPPGEDPPAERREPLRRRALALAGRARLERSGIDAVWWEAQTADLTTSERAYAFERLPVDLREAVAR